MSFLRLPSRRFLTSPIVTFTRPLSTTPQLLKTPPPPPNVPPNAQKVGKTTHASDDPQSSASTQLAEEHNTGDDHPAKQPDKQEEGDRSTGFNQVKGGVKGGKEGLDARTDK